MDNSNDLSVFEEIVRELKDDFQENPFQYGNEQPILGELYHRLRGKLADVNLPVEFVTDYGNKKKWRVRKARALQNKGNVYRVRTEVSFIHQGERLQLPKHTKDKELGHRVFDLAIFSVNEKLVMHSKKPGPGDFWDTKNDISVLCEVKHSRNMVSRFYSDNHGAKDARSLSAYPGEVAVFVL